MIFLTVGTDGPFDRLVSIVDQWAVTNGRKDVVAQIGRSKLRPKALQFQEFLEPAGFLENFASAEVVIAHAGMGTILTALQHGKPLLVMPRLASLGEQRNEHQLATARRLHEAGKVNVAFNDDELRARLQNLSEIAASSVRIDAYAESRLTASLTRFIHGEPASEK
jgi:UDP-N-acetylglucosamine transferase subunit ALG13